MAAGVNFRWYDGLGMMIPAAGISVRITGGTRLCTPLQVTAANRFEPFHCTIENQIRVS